MVGASRDTSAVASVGRPCENRAVGGMRGASPLVSVTTAMALAALTVACGFGAGGNASTVGPPDWPCDATDEFAFTGQTSLAAIGLNDFGGPDAARVGTIWVTAGPVSMEPPDIPAAQRGPPARVVCVRWRDGSGLGGPIDDAWQPPGGLLSSTDGSVGLPLTLLALAGAAAVVVAVSVLAFRERRG